MKHSRLAVAVFALAIAIAGGVVGTWPNWMVVVGRNGYVPPRIYRCTTTATGHDHEEEWVRTCFIGVDGLVYRKRDRADGLNEESWFAFGGVEYRRSTSDRRGKIDVLTRTLGDCWVSAPAGTLPPEGTMPACSPSAPTRSRWLR